jgi:hypothetical protein
MTRPFQLIQNLWYGSILQRMWQRIDSACPTPIKETGILALGLFLVDIVTVIGLTTNHDWYNPYTAYLIITTLAFAILVMLYGTPFWSFRVVGVAFIVIGDLCIYGPLVWTLHDRSLNEEARLSVARGFFIVGSIFVLYGLLRWAYDYRQYRTALNKNGSVLTSDPM